MTAQYERFLEAVARHEWHRSVVKKGLSALLFSLLVDEIGTKGAQNFMENVPYMKERYWKECFDRLRDKYGYTNAQLHTINSGIIGRIQFENLV
jgi:hypothetical protein